MNETLSIQQIAKVLIRRWWIIALCAIIGGSAAFTYSAYVVDPRYTSVGTLIVNNRRESSAIASIGVNDITAAQHLVNTYAIILKSNSFVNRVKEKTGLEYSVAQIQNMVTYASMNETEVLAVGVTTLNREHSAIIAETILDLAPEEIEKYTDVASVQVVDHATLPKGPSSPNIPSNTLTGGMLGAIVPVLILLVLELLDTRVKSFVDLNNKYKLPILGVIPTAVEKEETQNA